MTPFDAFVELAGRFGWDTQQDFAGGEFSDKSLQHIWELLSRYKTDVTPAIRQAITDYHYALDTRQHGGVAQDKALTAICNALDMQWQQGQEVERRGGNAPKFLEGYTLGCGMDEGKGSIYD